MKTRASTSSSTPCSARSSGQWESSSGRASASESRTPTTGGTRAFRVYRAARRTRAAAAAEIESMTAFHIIVVVIAGVAAASDVATKRIPNALTFGAALIGIVAHAYVDGWPGAGVAAAGWLVGVAAFLP